MIIIYCDFVNPKMVETNIKEEKWGVHLYKCCFAKNGQNGKID